MTTTKPFKLINCVITFEGTTDIIGGVQELNVKREDDNTVYHNAGSLDAADIVSGKRTITGSIKHGWLLTKIIKDYMNMTNSTENDIKFNINATVKDGSLRSVTIEGVKFKGLDLTMGLNDVIELNRDFDATKLVFK